MLSITVTFKTFSAPHDELKVSDVHQDGEEATIRLHEKGDKRRTIDLHFAAAQAIAEYIEHAGITSGPLFRPRLNPRSKKLANRPMDSVTMYRLIQSYLEQPPGAVKDVQPSCLVIGVVSPSLTMQDKADFILLRTIHMVIIPSLYRAKCYHEQRQAG